MFQKKTSASRILLAAVAAVGLVFSAMADRAHAFSFNDLTADVVVAIYGNDTEAMYNLGSFSTVFASGPNQTLNVNLTAASGPNAVRFAVFGSDLLGERIWGGTTLEASAINRNLVSQANQLNLLAGWAPASTFTGDTIAATDSRSFTTRIDSVAGAPANLGGNWPTNSMFGNVGDILNILETGEGDPNLNFFGRVQLVAGGPLGGQIIFGNPGPNPVPVPAAVVLFGSGLIGLIGVARRSLTREA